MNASDLLDYALGQLEGPALELAHQEIARDSALAASVDRLKGALDRLLDDGEEIEPPPDLVGRVHTFVADHVRQRRARLELGPARIAFRWTDAAAAASIFLATLLTLVPAVRQSKQHVNQIACGDNLRQVGLGLQQYAQIHQQYPYVHPSYGARETGTFAAILNETGLLPNLSALDCPSNGPCRHQGDLPDLKALAALRLSDPKRYHDLLCWDYAYNVGARNAAGQPEPIAGPDPSATLPLLADQPPHHDAAHRILAGNSPNHGGRGQNVYYADGHVNWTNTRRANPHDDDLYLNDNRRPAPSGRLMDAALLPSMFSVDGN